jgi:hypothetical protein
MLFPRAKRLAEKSHSYPHRRTKANGLQRDEFNFDVLGTVGRDRSKFIRADVRVAIPSLIVRAKLSELVATL